MIYEQPKPHPTTDAFEPAISAKTIEFPLRKARENL